MKTVNLRAINGDTLKHTVRWADGDTLVKKTITAITLAGICQITAEAHGLPNGWPFTVHSVLGMTEINNEVVSYNANNAPVEFGVGANGLFNYLASEVATDTLELNDVNSLGFTAYASGGILEYQSPIDLAGCTARLQVKSDTDATELLELTDSSGITLDNTNKRIDIVLSAAQTALLGDGVFFYDLEVTDGDGNVTTLIKGTLTIEDGTTT